MASGVGAPLRGYIVSEAELAEGGLGFFEFLLGSAAIGLDFHGEFELQAPGGGKFGEDLGVKVHPFLGRDFPGPDHAAECELLVPSARCLSCLRLPGSPGLAGPLSLGPIRLPAARPQQNSL